MIEEQATVIRVEGRRVEVAAARRSSCGHCSASSACGTSLLENFFKRHHKPLVFETELELAEGDTVILGMEEDALVKGSLLVYVLPLFMMMLFPVIASFATTSELVSIFAGIVGLAAGVWLVRRHLGHAESARYYRPVLLRSVKMPNTIAGGCTVIQE